MSKMEKEIEKLQEEIEVIKREIDRPPEYDETLTSNGSTIQAGMGPPGPIGEVIAELKAHNNAKAVKKKEGIKQDCHLGVNSCNDKCLTPYISLLDRSRSIWSADRVFLSSCYVSRLKF